MKIHRSRSIRVTGQTALYALAKLTARDTRIRKRIRVETAALNKHINTCIYTRIYPCQLFKQEYIPIQGIKRNGELK